MPEHIVKKGECMESIAIKYGLFWETIWNEAEERGVERQQKGTQCPDDSGQDFHHR